MVKETNVWVKGPCSVTDSLLKSTFCQEYIYLRILEIMSPISATCQVSRMLDFEYMRRKLLFHVLAIMAVILASWSWELYRRELGKL